MNLVNGAEVDSISVRDRGLAYGDGVFRTFAMRAKRISCWPRQFAKLASDCAALHIQCPNRGAFEDDLEKVAQRYANCAVKLVVTRGVGLRGYAISEHSLPTRIVSTSELPLYPDEYYRSGVRVHLCETRLAAQSALAGIKHLNRLEQVLARSEWVDPAVPEGLMRDAGNHVVCGTMSNLFLVERAALFTPALTQCGVAGVQRARVIDAARLHGTACQIGELDIDRLLAADEVFIVNSVIGVWQIAALDRKAWGRGALTAQVRDWLAHAEERGS